MTTKPMENNASPGQATEPDRFPVPFSLAEFQKDIFCLFLLQAHLISAVASEQAALRFLNKASASTYVDLLNPEDVASELDLTYVDIRNSSLARSLESMYRYAYYGELDDSVEELGPGGYHIGIAAIVKDMAESSYVKFCLWNEAVNTQRLEAIRTSIEHCLQTVELANARLTLEGQPRFFNFDYKDEDFDNLIHGGTTDTPQGGYGAALTIRQLSLLSGMGEMSIRTLANPKRANPIPTESRLGRTLVPIDAAKAWLKERGRYVPIRRGVNSAALDLATRRFVSTKDLMSAVTTRLAALNDSAQTTRFHALANRFGVNTEDVTAYNNPDYVRELADILFVPSELFALRVKEALLNEELTVVRRRVRETLTST